MTLVSASTYRFVDANSARLNELVEPSELERLFAPPHPRREISFCVLLTMHTMFGTYVTSILKRWIFAP